MPRPTRLPFAPPQHCFLTRFGAAEGAKSVMAAAAAASPPWSLGGYRLLVGYSRNQSLRLSHRPPEAALVSVPSARARQMGEARSGHSHGSPSFSSAPAPGPRGTSSYPPGACRAQSFARCSVVNRLVEPPHLSNLTPVRRPGSFQGAPRRTRHRSPPSRARPSAARCTAPGPSLRFAPGATTWL